MKLVSTILYMLGAVALTGSITFAAEETMPDIGSWHSWHSSMHEYWSGFWWIFPLMMMFMFIFFFFILSKSRGGWCRPGRWMREYPESQHPYEGDQSATSETALDILNKRYARGEIEKEEYEDKKTTISSSKT